MKVSNLSAVLVAFLAVYGVSNADEPTKIAIGMSPSMTADLNIVQQKFLEGEFPRLVREFTGLRGNLESSKSSQELGNDLATGKIHFGVFQRIEFAEIQAKNPGLQPLVVSIYRSPQIKTIVVVKKDSPFRSFDDLRGKDVAILKDSKEHIRRFTEKKAGGEAAQFFGNVVAPAHAEAALDAVLLGKVQVAIVDNATLDIYRDVNIGKFQRLRALDESIVFPPNVVAFVPNKIDPVVVKQFRDGMIAACKSARGRDAMGTFKITAFQPIPDGFDQSLASIREAYSK